MDGSPDCSTILLFGLIRLSMPMRHGLSGVPGGPTPSIALRQLKPLQSRVGYSIYPLSVMSSRT